jgi:hypothetical protein
MNPVDQRKAEAGLARKRLGLTFITLRERAKPESLLGDAKAAAKKRAAQAAITALSNSKVRPIVAVGVAATAIAYLFRNPILKALKKRMGKGDRHD